MEKNTGSENVVSDSSVSTPVYIGFALRFLASIIDSVLLTIVIAPILFGVYGPQVLFDQELMHDELSLFIQYGLPAIAVVIFWKYKSATPGKILLDMVIVDEKTGLAPSMKQSMVRYVGYYVSLLGAGLGFVWIVFDKKKRGWHDLMAGTAVIRKENTK